MGLEIEGGYEGLGGVEIVQGNGSGETDRVAAMYGRSTEVCFEEKGRRVMVGWRLWSSLVIDQSEEDNVQCMMEGDGA